MGDEGRQQVVQRHVGLVAAQRRVEEEAQEPVVDEDPLSRDEPLVEWPVVPLIAKPADILGIHGLEIVLVLGLRPGLELEYLHPDVDVAPLIACEDDGHRGLPEDEVAGGDSDIIHQRHILNVIIQVSLQGVAGDL